MRKHGLFFGILFVALASNAVTIHEPAEIIKLMEKSEVHYQLDNLKKPIPEKDYSEKVNALDSYQVVKDSTITSVEYNLRDSAKAYFDKAETYFNSNADSALHYYTLMRTAQPELYFGLTFTGQIFEKKGEYRTAMEWYKEAIKLNYIDYMAHWFLADAYVVTGEMDKALDEILIAHILNRNNPRLKKSLTNILKKVKRPFKDWYFNPQVEIMGVSENKVRITMDMQWMGYALAKALWEFEPGYRLSMGAETDKFSITEYKECLYSLLVGLENSKAKISKKPQLNMLREAASNKHLNEYILFEVLLPEYPFAAYQFSKETMADIKDYLLNIRYK